MFKSGQIHGVIIRDLKKFVDDRGWLAELFREDEVEQQFMPVMSYICQARATISIWLASMPASRASQKRRKARWASRRESGIFTMDPSLTNRATA